ncbi:replicative DNA helicase [Streptomyces spectabilis]|uniref:Replicative DNA helicase n=1 Tax=Streptomyces spectabilis TaxID=68270 RepID=A0A7W8B5G7_STRST|nr:replicative DNA helicase [Streptomyces spectabilis]MBB5109207.1 replicative DNA helicase [Streptomyces spectabilis]MCI3907762.1 replicative DNA helicase [Streptomyces spectabilis]GGV51368.1 replicative DNA helicase [Streptomyces spectabilis]
MDDTEARAAHLPSDMEAEKSVLRAVLLSASALAEIVEVLEGHDFYRPAHGLIYETALEIYASGRDLDVAAVSAALSAAGRLKEAGGEDYLIALTARSTGTGWRRAAERIQALAILRRTKEAAAHVENLATEASVEDIDRIADVAQAEILAATVRRRSGLPPAYSLGEVMEDALDEVEAVGSGHGLAGLSTGFNDLDSLTGGLYPGHLVVIAARPAMGSSTLAVDLLRTAAIRDQVPAVLFTLEASRVEVAQRITAAEARVALHHMRGGTMQDDDWVRMARRMPEISAAPLYIQDGAWPTFTDLRAQCRRLASQRQVKLIVIDNLQMLTYGTRPLSSRYEEISEIARCLKLLAKELHIPIVAVSKLNRGPEQRTDKKPQISDLRDSGALEDNADLVILLHREDAYEKESPRAGEADLIVAKHRNGPTATITVAFQGHYSRFVDMTQT